jgi:hypothetical protein
VILKLERLDMSANYFYMGGGVVHSPKGVTDCVETIVLILFHSASPKWIKNKNNSLEYFLPRKECNKRPTTSVLLYTYIIFLVIRQDLSKRDME